MTGGWLTIRWRPSTNSANLGSAPRLSRVWALRSVLFMLFTALATRAASALPALLPPCFFLQVLRLLGFATTAASLTARTASWMSASDMCAYQTSECASRRTRPSPSDKP